MKIYITGLPSGYEVEHLARLFYPMAPLTLTPPEPAEDCLWAEKTDTGLRVLVRQGEKSKMLEAPLPLPVERVRLLIGPEGGLSADEIAMTARYQFTDILLGPRVLRTETTALTAITALQVRFGDLG